MARYFHSRGDEAVAIGWGTSPSAIELLYDWADAVVVMEAWFVDCLPERKCPRVIIMDVGRDIWSNPYHPELITLIKELATRKGI